MDCELDWTFPNYNPNPEDSDMLHAMAEAVSEHGADLALGFDGDGDRCGVVDDEGEEIFADKIGLMLARDLSALHKDATFVVDVKSTGLYATDPVLKANGAKIDLLEDRPLLHQAQDHRARRPGRLREVGPLLLQRRRSAAAMTTASSPPPRSWRCSTAIPGKKLSDLKKALPVAYTSLTMSPALRRRDEVRRRRRGRRRIPGAGRERRQDPRPQDPRRDHRQRRARDAGGRLLGAGARLVQQARDSWSWSKA